MKIDFRFAAACLLFNEIRYDTEAANSEQQTYINLPFMNFVN